MIISLPSSESQCQKKKISFWQKQTIMFTYIINAIIIISFVALILNNNKYFEFHK